jgi:hypothetical protein
MSAIDGKELTTYQVAPDGSTFRLNFNDLEGRAAALTLPVEALNTLVMTMPQIARQAMKAKYRDDTIRLVYPIGDWRIEAAAGDTRLILTLRTPDGFEVSFAASRDDLAAMLRVADDKTGACKVPEIVFN